MRRVLNDPAPQARRLARALKIALVRYPRVLTHRALFTPRRYAADPADARLSFDILAVALAATMGIRDSS